MASKFYTTRVGDSLFAVPSRYQDLKDSEYNPDRHSSNMCSAFDTERNEKVHITKFVRPFQNDRYAKLTLRALRFFKMANHKNIRGILNLFTPAKDFHDFQDVYMVTEAMDASLTRVVGIDLDHDRLSYLVYQMLCGINYLHSAGVIHTDLQPSSFGVNEDCSLKIMTSGLSRNMTQNFMVTPYVVTRYYRSPEVITGIGYDERVDVWAVGGIFAELVRGKILLPGRDYIDQWNKVCQVLGTPPKEFFDHPRLQAAVRMYCMGQPRYPGKTWMELFPDMMFPNETEEDQRRTKEARDLLSKMLEVDPRKRISVHEALKHPYTSVWWEDIEVAIPAQFKYDSSTEDSYNIKLETLKRLIYNEVTSWNESEFRLGIPRSTNLFFEAMKEGYVTLEMMKIVISGVAGSGKTSTLALLLNQDPPTIRRSTPCARRPVRILPLISDSQEKSWLVLADFGLKTVLADFVKAEEKFIQLRRQRPSATFTVSSKSSNTRTSLTDESQPSSQAAQPSNTINDTKVPCNEGTDQGKITPGPESAQPSEAESQRQILQKASETEDDLVKLIDRSRHQNTFVQRRWMSVTDTGGQPQFQEVLPLFMRQTTLYVHVQNLSEALSDRPVIEFYDQKGNPLSNPLRSPLTNEEHVRCTIRSMQSLKYKATEDKPPMMLFVGTHEDLEYLSQETREEKEKKMAGLLLPAFKDDVIFCGNDMKRILFGINARVPGASEAEMAQNIRSIINRLFPSTGKKIPLRWFALQIKLQEIASILDRQIVTKKECLEAAHRLHFNSETALDVALKYLDELNIIFHYPQILPDVVFCDVQVLLDKITELVEHMYKLMEDLGDQSARTGEWKKFRDFGLITEAILEAFPSHYVPGIFTVNDLLKLFRTLLVIADFQTDNKEKPEYFMPCLLNTIETRKVEEYKARCKSLVPPLVLHFPHGLLSGVFCFTIASLLSAENTFPGPWKLLLHSDGSPQCLYRNIVQFTVTGFPGVVILIDMFDFIQIIVASPPSLCATLCPLVKTAVLQSLNKAAEVLNYIDCKAVPSILCPCADGSPHPAKASRADSKGQQWWMCSKNEMMWGELGASNKIWNNETSNATPVQAETEPKPHRKVTVNILDQTPKLKMLRIIKYTDSQGSPQTLRLLTLSCNKWRAMGDLCDIQPSTLDAIATKHHHDPSDCCYAVLTEWLSNQCEDYPSTWQGLIDLLTDAELAVVSSTLEEALGLK